MKEMEEILSEEEAEHESAPKPTTGTTTETGNKRKRGERGLNQFPKVTYRATDVSATGQPLAQRRHYLSGVTHSVS